MTSSGDRPAIPRAAIGSGDRPAIPRAATSSGDQQAATSRAATGSGDRPAAEVWRLVIPALLVAKLISLGVPLLTVWLDGSRTASIGDAFLGSFLHWDALHYVHIAQHGYAATLDFHQAFLPGFPALMAGLAFVVRDDVVAALIIGTVAEAAALYYIARLVLHERDLTAARFAVWCVALGPIAFFLSAVYPESLLIAAAAAALYHSRRGEHLKAAGAAAIACSMRLTGVALIPALIYECLRQSRGLRRRDLPQLVAILAAPFPILLYAAFLQVHAGDALAFLHAQSQPEFNHSLAWPWNGLRLTWSTMVNADGETQAVFVREILFAALGLLACVVVWAHRRFPRMLAVYCTFIWLMATSLTFWRSVPRYDLALFPIVIILADLTSRLRALRPVILGASGTILAWGAWVFARGHWLG